MEVDCMSIDVFLEGVEFKFFVGEKKKPSKILYV